MSAKEPRNERLNLLRGRGVIAPHLRCVYSSKQDFLPRLDRNVSDFSTEIEHTRRIDLAEGSELKKD